MKRIYIIVGVLVTLILVYLMQAGDNLTTNTVSKQDTQNESISSFLPDVPSLPVLNKNKAGYYETDVDTFANFADNPEVTMVNVHIPFGGEIPGTDVSVPYNETERLLASLPKDKTALVALYCRSGGMSSIASKDLVAMGYTNVYDLTGGMNAYKKSGRELLTSPSQ